ncbi:hypothetical protein KQH40_00550 [bacterium]|nr:hypothetical protein [bacterium]
MTLKKAFQTGMAILLVLLLTMALFVAQHNSVTSHSGKLEPNIVHIGDQPETNAPLLRIACDGSSGNGCDSSGGNS